MGRYFLLAWIVLAAPVTATAQPSVVFASSVSRVSVLELYTSEGCSSCPPAEAYLNTLRDNPALWKHYIPAAFHVDYWNYLGWRDRFSSSDYSARQRTYARHWRAATVYTPEFFVNGREWRGWRGGMAPDTPTTTVGRLTAELQNGNLTANFTPQTGFSGKLVLHIAILGMDRTTRIQTGENAGRHATHHFVVLGHKTMASDKPQWQTTLPQPHVGKKDADALAIWVTKQGNPVPVQAAGGFITP